MQEVVIVRFCDNDLWQHQEKVHASITRAIEGEEVDLCSTCDEALYGPMAGLVAAVKGRGGSAASAPAKPTPVVAPVPALRVQCGLCPDRWVLLRDRKGHAERSHKGTPAGKIAWWFPDNIEEVWECGCGLQFPSTSSRLTHIRRLGHEIPDPDRPVAPTRSPRGRH